MNLATITLASEAAVSEPVTIVLFLCGPAVGILFFVLMWFRYRNANATYHFEHETAIEVRNLQTDDRLADRIRGTSRSRTSNRNDSKHRDRVQRY